MLRAAQPCPCGNCSTQEGNFCQLGRIKEEENLDDTSFDGELYNAVEQSLKNESRELKMKIDPEYLSSLPAGWSYKNVQVGFGNIIKRFVSPEGKEFTSRIEAVRHLSEKIGCEEDAALLRSGLEASDGWISHPLLPSDWLAKPVCSNSTSSSTLKFLTEGNKLLVGKRKVFRHLEGSPDYDNLMADNINKFVSIYLNVRRATSLKDDWSQDDCLPEGWKYKTNQSGTRVDIAKIMSPAGELFPSRSKALLYMIQNGFSEEEVRKMRSSLVFDGWLESQFLPRDWSYRKSKSGRNEHDFLSPDGEVFKSRRSLVEHFQRSDCFSEKDVTNVDLLFEEIKGKWVNTKHEWQLDDPSVPSGWKIRYFVVSKSGKTMQRFSLLSPGGVVFQSRVKALQHLMESRSEGAGEMLDCLTHEGWQGSPLLPQGWRVKSKSGAGQGQLLFFTSEGSLLSLKAAVSHMETCRDTYSQADLDDILRLAKDHKERSERERTVWCSHPSVPSDWQYRSRQVNNSTLEYFLSPDGIELAGRITTIQWLLGRGREISDLSVQAFISGLSFAGWQPVRGLLPSGWWRKEKITKPGSFKYLSPHCKEFTSLTQVYHHLRANNCPSQFLNSIKKKLNLKNILSQRKVDNKERRTYRWQQADFLPPGWKFAEKEFRYCGTKILYLSESGILLKSAALAYQMMKAENVEVKYLAFIEGKLRCEGWEEDHYLPHKWRMNIDKSKFPEEYVRKDEETDVLFLTDEGRILSRNEASELISDKSSSEFKEEDLSNYLFFLSTLAGKIESKGWREDESIPAGWNLKNLESSLKSSVTQLRSPKGEIFNSFLSAFLHLISGAEVVSEDVEKLRGKLVEEGFMPDEKLPEGWLISRSRRGHVFEILSREGVLFLILNDAQDYMEASSSYSDKNILELEELCMEEVEIYLSSKTSEPDSRGVKRKYSV